MKHSIRIKILYFARLREALSRSDESLQLDSPLSLNDVRQHLAKRDHTWQQALMNERILVALNQEVRPWDTLLQDGDEVAFFPPVTGG